MQHGASKPRMPTGFPGAFTHQQSGSAMFSPPGYTGPPTSLPSQSSTETAISDHKQLTETNIARHCRIGQELVHEIVHKSTEVFHVLKATQVGVFDRRKVTQIRLFYMMKVTQVCSVYILTVTRKIAHLAYCCTLFDVCLALSVVERGYFLFNGKV